MKPKSNLRGESRSASKTDSRSTATKNVPKTQFLMASSSMAAAEVSKYRDNPSSITLRGKKASQAALVAKNKFIKQSEDENRLNC